MSVKEIKDTLEEIPYVRSTYRWVRRFIREIPFFVLWVFHFGAKRFSFVRNFLFLSAPKNSLVISSVDNEKFVLNTGDKMIARKIYVNGGYDFDKAMLVHSLIKPSSNDILLVDVGANIGSICIPFVKRGLVSKAIAIEPEPLNYKLLRANIILNDLDSLIHPINVALGESDDEKLLFELSEDNYGDHRVVVSTTNGLENEVYRKTIEVRSTTLDSILKNYDTSNVVIWMDTQGYEGIVLNGAKNALQKRLPMVLEFMPYAMIRANSYEKLKTSLIESGYETFFDLAEEQPSPKSLSADSIERLYESLGTKGRFTDILVM